MNGWTMGVCVGGWMLCVYEMCLVDLIEEVSLRRERERERERERMHTDLVVELNVLHLSVLYFPRVV